MELYFYNTEDQTVLGAVLIPEAASSGTDTCTVEPARCGPRGQAPPA